MKKAFTLVELMVVVGMIAVLMGAMTVSTAKAQQRGRIAKAMQETKEIANAILAYEQYAIGHTPAQLASKAGPWTPCTKSSLQAILGGETGASGETIPVLYNASINGETLRDPWGNAYEFMIQQFEKGPQPDQANMTTSAALPNFFRLSDKERSE